MFFFDDFKLYYTDYFYKITIKKLKKLYKNIKFGKKYL